MFAEYFLESLFVVFTTIGIEEKKKEHYEVIFYKIG